MSTIQTMGKEEILYIGNYKLLNTLHLNYGWDQVDFKNKAKFKHI